MQVVTRFAPTISGDLHIGSLYNALLNYLHARKHEGSFKLRLDGIRLTEDRRQWQESIQRDLELFGMCPDQTLKQSDRLDVYKEAALELEKKCGRSYHCDCTVQDLLHRASVDDSKFYHLYRPEKYPPYCKIAQVKVYGLDSEDNVAVDCDVMASHEARERSASILTTRVPSIKRYWQPLDAGYAFHPAYCHDVTIKLKTPTTIRAVEIVWKDRPVLEYDITAKDSEGVRRELVKVTKKGRYFYDVKQGQPYLPLTSDLHHFAPTEATEVELVVRSCPKPVDRPYFYDYHCRKLDKKLDLNSRDATLRLKFDPSIYCRCIDFVTGEKFPMGNEPEVDSCWWFGRQPDLVFTSPFDDHELGVTHLIRGLDIRPFFTIESQVALALDMLVKQQTYHYMMTDDRGYKYSKFVESTPARTYLKNGITADMIWTYIAFCANIVPDLDYVHTLDELTEVFDWNNVARHDVLIREQEMIETIRSRFVRGA